MFKCREIQWMMMWVEEADDPSCPGSNYSETTQIFVVDKTDLMTLCLITTYIAG